MKKLLFKIVIITVSPQATTKNILNERRLLPSIILLQGVRFYIAIDVRIIWPHFHSGEEQRNLDFGPWPTATAGGGQSVEKERNGTTFFENLLQSNKKKTICRDHRIWSLMAGKFGKP